MKNILIAVGVIAVLYLNGCFGTAQGSVSHSQPASIDSRACYEQVRQAVSGDWAYMSKAERAAIGLRAISICEGN